MSTPQIDRSALELVSKKLQQAGVEFALGGSGLMCYFGAAQSVNDWDLTTDASFDHIQKAIREFDFKLQPAHGVYASEFCMTLAFENINVDLIGGFALNSSHGVQRFPTKVTAHWDGVPVGCPESWARAYELMGKPEKAKRLRSACKSL